MNIKVMSNVEPCNIDITSSSGKVIETVRCLIDLSDSTVNANAASIITIQQRCEQLIEKLNTVDEINEDELAIEMADTIRPTICKFIGERKYNEILEAIGNGTRVEPYEANMVMTQLFAALTVIVTERVSAATNTKAAHYLQEYVDAQNEPDIKQRIH